MSMICCLRYVDDNEINRLLKEPKYIYEFVFGKPSPVKQRSFLSRLFTRKQKQESESESPEWVLSAEKIEADLDKAWHGIHFILTGTDWEVEEPWCYLVTGGETIGDVDVGYGPARALWAEDVRKFAESLEKIDTKKLRERFDPQKMMELDIYPTIWDRDPVEDDTLGYLIEYFHILRSFVKRAAEKGKGLIIYIC